MAGTLSMLMMPRGFHGFTCNKLEARRPIALLRFPTFCRTRKNLGSQRRKRLKKISMKQPSLNMKSSSPSDDNALNAPKGGISSSPVISSAKPDSLSSMQGLEKVDTQDLTLTKDVRNYLMEDDGSGQQLSNLQLEDLIEMIRNAEQNILLLNQARVRALEDLDKILSEKEALQGEINLLEMRLAETDARLKVATQEKINVELLEDQLEKLKKEMAERGPSSTEDGQDPSESQNNPLNRQSLASHCSDFSSLNEEVTALKEENKLLKNDIEVLKAKLAEIDKTDEKILAVVKERSVLEYSLAELESKLVIAQESISELASMKVEFKTLRGNVEHLQALLEKPSEQANHALNVVQQNQELQKKVDNLEAYLDEAKAFNSLSEQQLLQQQVKMLEQRLLQSDQEIQSQVQLYQDSINEFQVTLRRLKDENKERQVEAPVVDMPWEFWSRLLLVIDGWLLEKKISPNDAKLLRVMAWKRDARIRETFLTCKDKNESEAVASFLKLTSSRTSQGLYVIHIAAEMAPVAKVGGLGDVVSGLGKALQRKQHLVEVILPKYDCMQYDRIQSLKALDVVVQSYFDGQLFKNKVWSGIIEGLPVYFIEPLHPAKFFWRGQFYGEHDDFKRFSYFSRAALEFLLQAGKKPDIIHCHDWQTAFVAPLYWDIYTPKGLNSARIAFTCHNFEYQGTTPTSELTSCGLDVHQLNRPDRMQDNLSQHLVNSVKGGIVFSNIVTTVSPTYAQEVRTPEGGRGLHITLNAHSRKFFGILNGIDNEAWDPARDAFLRFQYNANDLHGKAENKDALRKQLKLSSIDANMPLVGCITRLVPQKGVHLIRHAIYRTLELGGQFLLLGSSPVPNIEREFEGIASNFRNHPHIRMILKYDEILSHSIYAASDMFIVPSLFEPCGLTQVLCLTVFDVDDDMVPLQFRNGFTFLTPDEKGVNSALDRAISYYKKNPEWWQHLVQKAMNVDFSWDSSASQYEDLYENSVSRARAANLAQST
ncbi:hypothetical protein AMTRI_Chr03g142970 [Amborella trichopoda]